MHHFAAVFFFFKLIVCLNNDPVLCKIGGPNYVLV